MSQEDIPGDAEIDPDLLDQLAKDSLKPEDIEIVHDAESGRSFIRSRNRMIKEAMGGVEKGHIYQGAKSKGPFSSVLFSFYNYYVKLVGYCLTHDITYFSLILI